MTDEATGRPANPGDAARLAELRYDFRAELDPPVEDRERFVARCRSWMVQQLRRPGSRWRCWVAERDGELLGHLWIQMLEKVPNPVDEVEQHAYLTNMYVEPEHRRGGIGDRLLEEGLHWCRRHRMGSVILWPTDESRSLYARHGFRSTPELLELSLNPSGGGSASP